MKYFFVYKTQTYICFFLLIAPKLDVVYSKMPLYLIFLNFMLHMLIIFWKKYGRYLHILGKRLYLSSLMFTFKIYYISVIIAISHFEQYLNSINLFSLAKWDPKTLIWKSEYVYCLKLLMGYYSSAVKSQLLFLYQRSNHSFLR